MSESYQQQQQKQQQTPPKNISKAEVVYDTIVDTVPKILKKSNPLATVNYVDLDRYCGKWYEIVRMPIKPENQLEGCTATYTKNPDGTIKVINTGKKQNGEEVVSESTFWNEDKTNSKLKIQYSWPFKADYQIIELDIDYQWALVGEPTRTYGWIISRQPQLDETIVSRLLNKMKDLEYDITKVHFDKHQ